MSMMTGGYNLGKTFEEAEELAGIDKIDLIAQMRKEMRGYTLHRD
jgi:hypothetical protein